MPHRRLGRARSAPGRPGRQIVRRGRRTAVARTRSRRRSGGRAPQRGRSF